MIRRVFPLLLAMFLADAAAAQSRKGLESLPHPGRPDNRALHEMDMHDFLEEQCTPRAFLETGRPIVDCRFWMRTPMLMPGDRDYPDAPPIYLRLASLSLYLADDDQIAEELWHAHVSLWFGYEASPLDLDQPDTHTYFAGSQGAGGVGLVANNWEDELTIEFEAPRPGMETARLLVNSHAAILPGFPAYSYREDRQPTPVTLSFERDPANFDPQ